METKEATMTRYTTMTRNGLGHIIDTTTAQSVFTGSTSEATRFAAEMNTPHAPRRLRVPQGLALGFASIMTFHK